MKRIYEYTDDSGDRIVVDVSSNDTLIMIVRERDGEAWNVLLPLPDLRRFLQSLASMVEAKGGEGADVPAPAVVTPTDPGQADVPPSKWLPTRDVTHAPAPKESDDGR